MGCGSGDHLSLNSNCFTHIKIQRASKHYIDGLSVAQDEYDNEVAARREVEAEVTRLKVQLSGQAALLTELSAGERKRDVAEKISRDISENLHGLERDLSKLKAERDLTAAEVEELVSVKGYVYRELFFELNCPWLN